MASWSAGDSINRGYTLTLTVTETGTSTAENTSTISYSLELACTHTRYEQFDTGFTVSINGSVVASQPRDWMHQTSIYSHYSSITLASGTLKVAHNSDGTKTIACFANLDISSDLPGPGPISIASQNLTLTNIPRSSTMTMPSSMVMGRAYSFTVTKAVSSYQHSLLYSFGSSSGTAVAKTSSTTISWTPPTSLGSQIPSAVKGTLTLTLRTFSGDTALGDRSYTVDLSIPSNDAPTGTLTCSFDNSGNATIRGWGVGVKGYSKISWSSSISGKWGATISAYSFSFGGYSASTASGTSSVLQSAVSSSQPSMTVTDSRGNKATIKASAMTVYDYAFPVFNSSIAYRANSSGTKDDSGTCVYKKISASYSSVGGHNGLTRRWRSRLKEGSWGGYTTLSENTGSTTAGFEVSKSYEIELSIVDSLGSSRSIVYTIATSKIAYHIRKTGDMIGMLGYGTKPDAVEIHGGLHADYIYGTALANGTDLNSLKYCGRYYSTQSSYTFPHSPITGRAFDLFICPLLRNGGTIESTWSYFIEYLIPFGTNEFYARQGATYSDPTSISFGEWKVYGHTSANNPLALGTASPGTSTEVSRSDHVHPLPDISSLGGTLAVSHGGTGATDSATARSNLGLVAASYRASNSIAGNVTWQCSIDLRQFRFVGLWTTMNGYGTFLILSTSTYCIETSEKKYMIDDGTSTKAELGVYTNNDGNILYVHRSGSASCYVRVFVWN